jgi:hypothetical protein
MLDAILLLSALIGIFCVYVMRGLRWLAVSFFLVEECLLFGAMFIAGMAISGDWIWRPFKTKRPEAFASGLSV